MRFAKIVDASKNNVWVDALQIVKVFEARGQLIISLMDGSQVYTEMPMDHLLAILHWAGAETWNTTPEALELMKD